MKLIFNHLTSDHIFSYLELVKFYSHFSIMLEYESSIKSNSSIITKIMSMLMVSKGDHAPHIVAQEYPLVCVKSLRASICFHYFINMLIY